MRLFLALRPSEDAVEHLDEFLEPRQAAFDLGWTPPRRWHLTLAFLSDVPQWQLDDLIEATEVVVARRRSWPMALAGGGTFPDPFAALVFWAGVSLSSADAHELDRLAAGCRTAAARIGLAVDAARFRPHLTLARSRKPRDAGRWLSVLDTYRGPTWTADRVEIVRSSHGEGSGPVGHQVLATLPLGGGPDLPADR